METILKYGLPSSPLKKLDFSTIDCIIVETATKVAIVGGLPLSIVKSGAMNAHQLATRAFNLCADPTLLNGDNSSLDGKTDVEGAKFFVVPIKTWSVIGSGTPSSVVINWGSSLNINILDAQKKFIENEAKHSMSQVENKKRAKLTEVIHDVNQIRLVPGNNVASLIGWRTTSGSKNITSSTLLVKMSDYLRGHIPYSPEAGSNSGWPTEVVENDVFKELSITGVAYESWIGAAVSLLTSNLKNGTHDGIDDVMPNPTSDLSTQAAVVVSQVSSANLSYDEATTHGSPLGLGSVELNVALIQIAFEGKANRDVALRSLLGNPTSFVEKVQSLSRLESFKKLETNLIAYS